MLLLSKKDMQKVFTMHDAVAATKQALRIYSEGGSVVPLRVNIGAPHYEGQTLFMPGYVPALDSLGVKIVSVFPRNSAQGLPSVPATMVLIDGTNGQVCCLLDGTYLTQLRTGAAAGAAADLLARQDARIGALIGTGGQALTQLEAMLTVRNLREVRIVGRNPDHTRSFVRQSQEELANFGTLLRAVETSEEAVTDADIITAVTTSAQPVFDGRLVKAGAHINGVGSYLPEMQELDEFILRRADKIFFDSQEAVLSESGDLIIPLAKGTITADNFSGEIGRVVSRNLPGRETPEEITIFKTVGIAVLDIVTAQQIYQRALEQGIGREFSFS
ncbi:ornithine cyclodeaminase family protein [Desulfosporosinus sp. PR]|uniref:ornithine cyclodeaminase family protein n=1 Tax=Candidatus Desulfosporosinus nitrosoreducens TaxID=3401928 RepID=UPI0027E7EAA5|nr:ornithine cyclodeaminase family protein [Desulfosporosinus sp. PR]MDQ7094475.1 ornithine cyclodeaminase family protein [Desulfosporosinus sp. PR]